MPSAVVILIVVIAGLFVGSRLQSAHEAHTNYNSYRARTARGFNTWLKSLFVAGVGVAVLIALVYVLMIPTQPH